MEFKKIGFIGLGLIGGSIAKKIKKDAPGTAIYATARRRETIAEAHALGLIENSTPLPLSGFADCDCIFLCAPVQMNLEYLHQLKDIIAPHTVITDVGSTKTQIHEEAIRLGLESNFIGGHPMTGSEKTGIANASEYLLENAYYIITPTACTTSEQLAAFRNLVLSLKAIPLVLGYREHDHATAAISHLPHMIAYTLVNLIQEIDDNDETMKTIAAGGFKDITRIASSSPIMWENICASNCGPILELMDAYMQKLTQLRSFIADSEKETLLSFFQSAKNYRDSIAVPVQNGQHRIHEIYLDLADEAGGIATIATILAGKGISIKNIGIINNREFEEGVLRIEFYEKTAKELAAKLLTDKNYVVHRR